MASILGPRAGAQLAMREGANATSALRAFRAAGGQVRTQTWYRLYGQAQLEGAFAGPEFSASPRRIPTSAEIQPATVPRARGYMQRVVVYGRDREGNVIARDVSLRSSTLVSRQNAIDKALALVQAGLDDPDRRDRYAMSQLLMGAYGGTYQFQSEEP